MSKISWLISEFLFSSWVVLFAGQRLSWFSEPGHLVALCMILVIAQLTHVMLLLTGTMIDEIRRAQPFHLVVIIILGSITPLSGPLSVPLGMLAAAILLTWWQTSLRTVLPDTRTWAPWFIIELTLLLLWSVSIIDPMSRWTTAFMTGILLAQICSLALGMQRQEWQPTTAVDQWYHMSAAVALAVLVEPRSAQFALAVGWISLALISAWVMVLQPADPISLPLNP